MSTPLRSDPDATRLSLGEATGAGAVFELRDSLIESSANSGSACTMRIGAPARRWGWQNMSAVGARGNQTAAEISSDTLSQPQYPRTVRIVAASSEGSARIESGESANPAQR